MAWHNNNCACAVLPARKLAGAAASRHPCLDLNSPVSEDDEVHCVPSCSSSRCCWVALGNKEVMDVELGSNEQCIWQRQVVAPRLLKREDDGRKEVVGILSRLGEGR